MNQSTRNNLHDTLWMIVIATLGAVLIFCCGSCSTTKKVVESSVSIHDSIYITRHDTVSIADAHVTTDSVYVERIVYVTLDSVGNETKRVEYNNTFRGRNDATSHTKDAHTTDTVYVKEKYEGSKISTTEKAASGLSFLDKLLLGWSIITTILLLLLFGYLKLKS